MNKDQQQIIINIISQINLNRLLNQENLIFDAIKQNKSNVEPIFKLAIKCAQNNKLAEAELILRCLSLNEIDNLQIHYNLGLVYSLIGNHHEAVIAYNKALLINPNDVETHINKSSSLNDMKKYSDALKSANDAININTQFPEAWANRGSALNYLGLFTESIESYQEAYKLNPLFIDALLNQNIPLIKTGQFDKALEICDEALRIQRNSDKAHSNKAITLNELERYDEALMHFDKAIALNQNVAEYFFGKGVTLHKLNRYAEALTQYNIAARVDPNYAESYHHKGITLNKIKKNNEALIEFRNAININPDKPDYWFSIGNLYLELSQPIKARAYLIKALDLDPNFNAARWGIVFSYIPGILTEDDDIKLLRDSLIFELKQFTQLVIDKKLDGLHKLIGLYQPFYLAYQDFNNKSILNQYGFLCSQIMRHWQQENKVFPLIKPGIGKIRVGIVSSHIYDHSVWHAITKGLLINLDLNKFEIHLFYLGVVVDEETVLAKSKSTTFSSNRSSLLFWAKLICEKSIEVLIYPEIGMHQLTTQLANLRLSKMQIAAWGHPETTGLPNIDYYLTGDLYEPDKSDSYTEKLLRLPNLASCYYRLPVEPIQPDLNGIILNGDVPVLLCPGTPFKYNPTNDWIIVEIARRLGRCKFVFFNYNDELSHLLKSRFEKKFNAVNLSIDDFIVFIPWLEANQFYGLMCRSCVFLDTIGFSGFNTAIQAIDCALPIVTKESQFLRGRLASGLLKRIGMHELITHTDNEYINLVVKLVQDRNYHQQVKERIVATRSLLYQDKSPVRALEHFLIANLRN